MKTITNICWYTNLPSLVREPLGLTEEYSPDRYPFYDNYPDIIECGRTKNIPRDYYGKIGVPISFLNYWCPDQFEILGMLGAGGDACIGKEPAMVGGKSLYARYVIRRKI